MPAPPPRLRIDTHAHVFHPGLPMAATRRHTPDYEASLPEYLGLLDDHGLSHGVLVQPSFLGTDNRHIVESIARAPQRLRGVAILDESATAAQVDALHEAGVVGLRLNLFGLPFPDLRQPAWQRLLARINHHGWHVELHVPASRLDVLTAPLLAAGCKIVVDHFGRPDAAMGADDPGFRHLLEHGGSRQVWVKLSAPYRTWRQSTPPPEARRAAQMLLAAFGPERLLWGSDWPHTEHHDVAAYGDSLQWLSRWIDDPLACEAILGRTAFDLFQFQGDRS